MSNWDGYFMGIARMVGENSKCLSRKIGAVLVRDNSIISTGYNGVSRKIPHCENRNPNREMICPRRLEGYESGEGLHLCIASHAETNAIYNAARMGHCTNNSTLYLDACIPCKDCFSALINAGIIEIVYNKDRGLYRPYYDEMSKYLVEHSTIIVRGIEYP